jgi:FixJ family two-component response regulator/GGDEF domain-containing protein
MAGPLIRLRLHLLRTIRIWPARGWRWRFSGLPNAFQLEMENMSEKILFVDDEPAVLEGYQRLLHRDFTVCTAVGGYLGLAAIEANGPFAVVVSDMRMPEISGVEFLAQVRQKSPDSVRMLLTGHADFNAAIEAVNQGNIYKFLTKPCEKETLVSAIRSGLSEYSTASTLRILAKKAEAIELTRSDRDSLDSSEPDRFEGKAGLPGPSQAQAYLYDRIGADQQCYVLMIKLTTLHTVEDRYGEQAATGYLMCAVEFLTQRMSPGDKLFHWSGDVLMAVIRRKASPNAVRMEASRLFMNNPQHLVEQNGRRIMIAITTTFDLLPVAQFSTLDDLMTAFKSKDC